ncbi:hypothetical protein GCM10023149_45630 [Mucilaginibacter gynuensis]|uniref:Uncharacterized protein n=1 Tax=Mucilaginibacter gynuensis TaxID=1302236 RepID=A0ABP8HB31_9SPHI
MKVTYSKFMACALAVAEIGLLAAYSYSYRKDLTAHTWTPYVAGFIMAGILLTIIYRNVVPAFKNAVALEMNEHQLINNTDNRTLDWTEIKKIHLFDSGVISIELHDAEALRPVTMLGYLPYGLSKLMYRSPLVIGTRMLNNKATVIHETMLQYWNAANLHRNVICPR